MRFDSDLSSGGGRVVPAGLCSAVFRRMRRRFCSRRSSWTGPARLLRRTRTLRFVSGCGVFTTARPSSPFVFDRSVPVGSSQSQPASPSRLLSACEAEAPPSGQGPGGEGDVRRGHAAVTLEDGRRVEQRTVSVETRHVLEPEERELPAESSGQLHEGDSYVVRWTYTLAAQGGRPLVPSHPSVRERAESLTRF